MSESIGILDLSGTSFPILRRIFEVQVAVCPGQKRYLLKRLALADPRELQHLEKMAKLIAQITGDRLEEYCRNYGRLCELMIGEEIFFRRQGRYRCESFQEALDEVYSDRAFMSCYMDGLLLSQLWWRNHTRSMIFFIEEHLRRCSKPFNHLEIGPGHGFYLYFACQSPQLISAEAWDVSQASLDRTRNCLEKLGGGEGVRLRERNLFDPSAEETNRPKYDSIALSEVLEHLEDPAAALRRTRSLLRESGRLFINVPLNSPAPDHIYLLRTAEEAEALVEEAGLKIEKTVQEPGANLSLKQANKNSSTVSCLITAFRVFVAGLQADWMLFLSAV